MTDQTEQERQKFILEISRMVDAIRDEYLSGEPDWGPLHAAIPIEHCNGFMWMQRFAWNGEVVESYKHGITRRYINLDHRGHAYLYRDGEYVDVPVGIAVELVFADLSLMGATRETAYNEAYIREKHRKAREMGWTIIS